MRTAVLHIGLHKTGTTTIQDFLHRNADRLRTHGIHVPEAPGRPNHHGLAVYAMEPERDTALIWLLQLRDPADRERYREQVAAALHQELESLPADIERVVFSNEHCSTLKTNQEIDRLKELLTPHFDRFEIICYLRSHDRQAISAYTQRVKGGITEATETIDRAMSGTKSTYLSLAQAWGAAFGDDAVRFRVFDRHRFVNGDLLDDFCAAAGIPPDAELERSESKNAGLTHNAVLFLRLMNEHIPAYVDGQPNPDRARLVPILSRGFGGDGLTVQRDQVRQLMRHYEETDSELARTYLGENGPLFDVDLSRYPDAPIAPLSGAEAVAIAAYLWREQTQMIEELRATVQSKSTGAVRDRLRATEERLHETEQQLRGTEEQLRESGAQIAALEKQTRSGRAALRTLGEAGLRRFRRDRSD